MTVPITRAEARRSGEKRYAPGTTCPQGHVAERYTGSGSCVVCVLERTKRQTELGYFQQRYSEKHESIRAKQKAKHRLNPEPRREYSKQWAADNPERSRALKREYKARKRASSPEYILAQRLRARIRTALLWVGAEKKTTTTSILGCSIHEFQQHIERQFKQGMSWDRIGDIHIDHIRPLASAKSEADVLALCHYTNLQPLWAADNLKKWAHAPDMLA